MITNKKLTQSQSTSDTTKAIADLQKQIADLKKPSPQNTSNTAKTIANLQKQITDLKSSAKTRAPADSTVFLRCLCTLFNSPDPLIIGSGNNQSEALQDVNTKCKQYATGINIVRYHVENCAIYKPKEN